LAVLLGKIKLVLILIASFAPKKKRKRKREEKGQSPCYEGLQEGLHERKGCMSRERGWSQIYTTFAPLLSDAAAVKPQLNAINAELRCRPACA
jgi:hypothetical protein